MNNILSPEWLNPTAPLSTLPLRTLDIGPSTLDPCDSSCRTPLNPLFFNDEQLRQPPPRNHLFPVISLIRSVGRAGSFLRLGLCRRKTLSQKSPARRKSL